MTILILMYSAWAALAVFFLALLVYRSTLSRYEEEKLFLDGHDESGEQVQTEIIRKMTITEPFLNFLGTATGLMTASILGVYVYRAILVLQS